MKKKGFTLIELLAVIVVLAIIALIATPIVMNAIKNSKKGAAERTADNYVDQVETSLMTYRLEKGSSVPNGKYEIDSNGNLTGKGLSDPLTIEMSGTKPLDGTIFIENGGVKKEDSFMYIGDYYLEYDTTKKTFVVSENNGSNIEILCTANTEKVNAIVTIQSNPVVEATYENMEVGLLASEVGSYTPGVSYTCNLGDKDEVFYVLEENGDNISLILGRNIGKSEWCTQDDYVAAGNLLSNYTLGINLYPYTALNYLKTNTNWTKLDESQLGMPSAEQIATASGKTFDGTNYVSELPTWLLSSTENNSNGNYFTTTYSGSVWYVSPPSYASGMKSGYNTTMPEAGIRPVITLSKAQLG